MVLSCSICNFFISDREKEGMSSSASVLDFVSQLWIFL